MPKCDACGSQAILNTLPDGQIEAVCTSPVCKKTVRHDPEYFGLKPAEPAPLRKKIPAHPFLAPRHEWVEIDLNNWVCVSSIQSVQLVPSKDQYRWLFSMLGGMVEKSGHFLSIKSATEWMEDYVGIKGIPSGWNK